MKSPIFQLVPIASHPVKTSLAPPSLLSHQLFTHVDKMSLKLLCSRQRTVPAISASAHMTYAPVPLLDSLQYFPFSLALWSSAWDPALQMHLTRALQKERITSLNLLAMLILTKPRMSTCHRRMLLAHDQLDVHQDRRSFSAELYWSWSAPSVYWCLGLFLPRFRTYFAFPIVELPEVPVRPFLWPVEVPLNDTTLAYQPLLPVWHYQQTLWVCILSHDLCHWGRWSKNIILGTNPGDRKLATGLQLNFVLITTLWAWQFRQFSVHLTVHVSSPYFITLSMRMLRKTK